MSLWGLLDLLPHFGFFSPACPRSRDFSGAWTGANWDPHGWERRFTRGWRLADRAILDCMGLEWSGSEVESAQGASASFMKLLKVMWKNYEWFDMPSKAKVCCQSPRLLPILGGTQLHHAQQEGRLPGGPNEEAKKQKVREWGAN